MFTFYALHRFYDYCEQLNNMFIWPDRYIYARSINRDYKFKIKIFFNEMERRIININNRFVLCRNSC